jgi:Flavin containing amine oxidoreductase/PHD-like zinc-binding domain
MQFPKAFWRTESCGLASDQTLFGNASGIHPHHYMFFDIGKSLGDPHDEPAILMSLISGREAVNCERMTESELVGEALETLRVIFSEIEVPDPTAVKATKWGSDPFSRGSYTFLPPGATDQDFRALQSPVNGNGDSLLLEGSETMRLFFAGEHTTAMHPSMAHGALLSGVRAGEEVVTALSLSFPTEDAFDKLIPMAVFRHMNPKAPLECSFCHLVGGRTYEGPLLAFKRGSRQVLVHNCCAEFSPEVEVEEGQWRYVIKAVNRASSMQCCICKSPGASIGCNHETCFRCFHFKCGESTGWKFEDDGKEFYCDLHRSDDVAPSWKRSNGAASETSLQHALFSTSPSQQKGQSRSHVDDSLDASKNADRTGRLDDSDADEEQIRAGKLTRWNVSEGEAAASANSPPGASKLVRLQRPSLKDCWNVELQILPVDDATSQLWIDSTPAADDPPSEPSVTFGKVKSMNGYEIGSRELDTVPKVVKRLSQEVDVFVELECDKDEED